EGLVGVFEGGLQETPAVRREAALESGQALLDGGAGENGRLLFRIVPRGRAQGRSRSTASVRLSTKATSTSKPRPGEVGTSTVPSLATSTSGPMISRSKYRRLPEMSPGRVKPGRLARATLWARPMPDSNIPPHHKGA